MALTHEILFGSSLAAPFFASAVSPLAGRVKEEAAAFSGVLAAVISFILVNYFWLVYGGTVLVVDWIPSAGVRFILRLDALAYLFAVLITGIGAVILLYSHYYVKKARQRYFMYLLLFMGSMLGLVLAGDLLSLFVFWELTTISSFLLIGFDKDEPKSQSAAFKALLITGLGGLSLLASFILIGVVAGTFEIDKILRSNEIIRSSVFYLPLLLLFAGGVVSKSAQFPLHIWLPDAMVAPTPISAYLHSAAMVKAGVYLLARFVPALASVDWQALLYVVGLATSLLGGVQAICSTELKRILAYSTVSQLGLLVWAFSTAVDVGQKAGLLHIFSHALAKASLFLVVGAVSHATGVNDIRNLGGLGRKMPITATAAAISAFSLAGIPPTLGFQSKELLFETSLKNPTPATPLLLVVGSGLTFAYIIYFFAKIFMLGGFSSSVKEPVYLALPALLLALANVVMVLLPSFPLGLVYTAVYGSVSSVEFKLSAEGVSMSLASAALGLLIIRSYGRASLYVEALSSRLQPYSVDRYYGLLVGSVNKVAARFGLMVQNGSIRRYSFALLAFGVASFTPSFMLANPRLPMPASMFDMLFVGVLVGMVVMAGLAAFFKNMLYAVLSLSGNGFLLALTFMLMKAPDLAMTQIVVELVFIFFFLIVLYKIPARAIKKHKPPSSFDLLLAVAAALGSASLLNAALSNNYYPSDAYFFLDPEKVKQTGGTNIVNIILVDFRAFDTWGEITVLVLAALASYTLLRRWKHD
ncbi:MAG: hydrogen gas-evolving membrane-bound hydrogenase subunit E [Candidatus Caldarchaeum sp.]